MASESAERDVVRVRLPADLEDWLSARAAALDVDRETILLQLIASYRAASDLDDPAVDGAPQLEVAGPETVRELLDPSVEAAATAAAEEAIHERVDSRLDDLDEAFQAKVEDVRDRVIQVKREVDGKASADHDHPELERIDAVDDRLADLESVLADLESHVDATEAASEEAVGSVEADVAELDERLRTVAWVVKDLRDATERGGAPALDRIKRSAAEADAGRATCERCGEGIEIGLLAEPECPHCEAALRDFRPSSGWFGSPTLLVATETDEET